MHLIDWILTAMPLLMVLGIGIYTQRYMKSVSHFMSGGRVAGRYLLAVAGGEMQAGAVVFVALFEVIGQSGFTLTWWRYIGALAALIVAVTGFVVYRYRQTRAMTLAQFFEIRYSKSFRLCTGILGFLAGILNFAIIPAIGSRFLVYFLGLPPTLTVLSFSLPTYIPMMAFFLSIALFVTLSGGVITLMIANCIEGIVSQIFYLAIIVALLVMFSWSQISEVLESQPQGHSFLNPFDSTGIKDFNFAYVLMSIFVGVYGTMAWQNASAYNAAAASPHESRMARILTVWREMGKGAVVTLLGICALAFLAHPTFAAQAAPALAVVSKISDPQVQEQMRIPIAVSYLLPMGIKGIFCAILLMGIFGGDATHLHSWGGIFVQDVLVPLRKKPFSPRTHILMLRLSITGVAVFSFLFGSLFRQTEYIIMWWSVTTAVYVGGAGAAIIGGLYWKKGTTAGAWAGLLAGSILSGGGILARQFYGERFPFNGMEVSFYATLIAISLYVMVSLFTHREDFNLDRMLHRGIYSAIQPLMDGQPMQAARGKVWLGRLIGLDENFSVPDKWIAGSAFAWNLFFFIIFVIGTIWNLLAPWPISVWSAYWHIVGVGLPVLLAAITGIWFTWGGLRDMRNLFRQLRAKKINHLDDGTVVDHQNLDELVLETKQKHSEEDAPKLSAR